MGYEGGRMERDGVRGKEREGGTDGRRGRELEGEARGCGKEGKKG